MEREKDRMREGMRVVLKGVRYSGGGWRGGGQRYAKQRGMCKRERVSETGRLEREKGVQSAQGKHKKGGK